MLSEGYTVEEAGFRFPDEHEQGWISTHLMPRIRDIEVRKRMEDPQILIEGLGVGLCSPPFLVQKDVTIRLESLLKVFISGSFCLRLFALGYVMCCC